MNFTCEGCFQNSTRQSKYTCKKYSSWLKHISGPDHVQWSLESFPKWTARECDSSIVIVILPAVPAKQVFKLSHKDIIDAFISDGIIQNVFVDRSGNFAAIQFDDVMSCERLQEVKEAYLLEGCQEKTIQDRNVLLLPRSAAVFNDATWKFLKQNHEVKKIKQTLAPLILNAPKSVATSSESPELEIVPLKPKSTVPVPVEVATVQPSKATKIDKPTVSSKIRVFVNSSLPPEDLKLIPNKQQQNELSHPPTITNLTSLNGIRLHGPENDIERPVLPKQKSRQSKRQRSKSSTSGEEQQPPIISPSNTKVPPLQKRNSEKGPDEGLTSGDVIGKALAQLAASSNIQTSNLSIVNAGPTATAETPPQNIIITGSQQHQQPATPQHGPILPVPVFRPQPFPMTGSPVKPALNPFFSPSSGLPFRPTPRQTHPVPPGLAVIRSPIGFPPGMRMGMMGQRAPLSQTRFVHPINSHIPYPIPPGVNSQSLPKQDFYYLFAQMSNSGYEKKLSKEAMKNLVEGFLKLPLDKQMYSFNAATTITSEERHTRSMVICELQGYLEAKFPKSKIYVFGSMTTHLCGTDSDIDVVVDLYGKLDTESGTEKTIIRTVQKYLESIKGAKKNRSLYSIQPVLQARVPILKMIHQETKIHLDLSFENFMSVRNSNLISLYMRLDSRIGALMIFIRYFAKFHELSGSFVIKNYAFLLLVVNYMSSKKYVPTIEQLQQWHDSSKDPRCIIDGWNTGFCDNLEYIQRRFGKPLFTQPPNWADILDLIYGFFKMYSELDYENNVICPLIGDTLPREQFQPGHEEQLPPCMERYKIYTCTQNLEARFRITSALKLQDPFHLQFNVGSITPAYVLFSFRILCANTVETLHNFRTIKKRVPNILDLLQKLPSYVGKDSFNLQQAARQRIWLSHELSLVFGDDDDEESEFDASIVSLIVEPQVNLREVPDLWLVKKLVEIGKITAHQKCGNLEFDIGRRFYQFFAQNICKLEELSEPDKIINRAKLLWAHFVMDYLRQIWSTGFQMGISMRVKWTVPPALPLESIHPAKTLGFNSDDAVQTSNVETKIAAADQAVILEKLEDLAKNCKTGEVYYFKMTTTGSNLFYQGRKTIHRKLTKASQQTDESGNNNSQTVLTLPKKKKQLDLSVNPIEFEGSVTTAVLEKVPNNKAQNSVTRLKAYGKLDLKLDEDDVSPMLNLVFRKSEKGSSLEAFDTVVKTIRDTLPNYVLHRLLQFFKAFGSEENPTQDYPPVDFGLEEESDDDEKGNGSEREEETGDDPEFPMDDLQTILDEE